MGFDHKIIDAIPTLAWCAQPGGANEFLNRRWHDYTGLSVEEGLGWGWKTAIHPDDLGRLTGKWQTLLAAGEPGESEANRFATKPARSSSGTGRRPTSKIENGPSCFAPPRSGRWR